MYYTTFLWAFDQGDYETSNLFKYGIWGLLQTGDLCVPSLAEEVVGGQTLQQVKRKIMRIGQNQIFCGASLRRIVAARAA